MHHLGTLQEVTLTDILSIPEATETLSPPSTTGNHPPVAKSYTLSAGAEHLALPLLSTWLLQRRLDPGESSPEPQVLTPLTAG